MDTNKNEVKVFKNEEFGEVRTTEINSEPWFVISDVCKCLELENPSKTASRLDKDDITQSYITDSLGRKQFVNICNEAGLYDLVLKSDKPNAKNFKKWITHEILPTIRKTGSYSILGNTSNLDEIMKNPEFFRNVAHLIETNQILTKQVEQDKPKVGFYEQVIGSNDTFDMSTCAKVLNMGIGRNKIFEILRKKGVLMETNQPYQKYVDMGYFRIVENKWIDEKGETHISIKTVIYQKGLDYIRKILSKQITYKEE